MIPEVPPSNNQKLNKSVALVYLNAIKDIFQDKMEKYDEFLEVMEDFKSHRIDTNGVMMRVKELFKGHCELILGFNTFLPLGYDIKLPEEKKPIEFDEAFCFVNKIKTRFQNEKHIYMAFLDILNMYRRGNKSIQDVCQEVEVLFRSHLDLFEEFKQCLPNISAPTDLQHRAEKDLEQDGRDFELTCKRKASRKFYDSSDLMHQGGGSTKNFGMYSMSTSSFEDKNVLKRSLWNEENMAKLVKIEDDRNGERVCDDNRERDKDRERFDKGSHYVLKDAANNKVHLASNKEKFNLYKPISELDLSNCQQSTPSYRLLPKNYLMPSASQRTKLGASVLNDAFVSVASGNEDYSFKHMRKNQYEENLSRCEDDRFELDMLLESVNAATKRVEELLKKIEDKTIKPESPFLIEDHFTPLNLRCIERLYGDHGLDVMNVLRKNASLALPVILTRLKQKQEEWSKCRADFNKVWAETYSKNFHKSLDHRSFYFEQQDTKNLSAKALLSEVKETSEKKRKEDDALLSNAAGNRLPIIPSIEFEYLDLDIFNDIHQLVKYSSCEMCTSSDQFDKVMKIWTSFLEPIFGVPPRPQGTDDTVGVSKTKALNKYSIASAGERNGIYLTDGLITNSKSARVDVDISNRDAMVIDNDFHDNDRPVHLNDNILKVPVYGRVQTCTIAGERSVIPIQGSTCRPNHSKPNYYHGISSQNEREEGELSPNGDCEEDNFISFVDTTMGAPTRQKGSFVNGLFFVNGQVEALCETAGENDVNADEEGEESIQRSTDDSGNASEARENISGSDEEEDVNQDAKAESEGEAEGIADAHDVEGEITSLPTSEHFLRTVKPISKHVPSSNQVKGDSCSKIFYGNDSFYVLFRLHQTLYERMLSAKVNSAAAERKQKFSKDLTTDLYIKLKTALHSLLDGSADITKFEDDCRAILGTQSYLLFALDKLIYKIVEQLQAIVSDDMDNKLCQLYFYEKSRQPGRFFDTLYHENARILLHDESVYRFEFSSNSTKLSIQLMENGLEKPEATGVFIEPNFSSYMFNDYLSSTSERNEMNNNFMKRNKRKFKGDDDLDGLRVFNELECKIAKHTSKVSYVLDTEDILFRAAKRRRNSREL